MSVDTKTSPVVADFLRQVNALPTWAPGSIDLTSLWIAAGSPPDGRPDRWRTASLAMEGDQPTGTWSEVEGRAYATGLLAFNYLVRLDVDLDYLSAGFRGVMRDELDVFLPFAVDPTPSKAAIAIGVILANAKGCDLSDAVATLRRGIELYAENSTAPEWDIETACARMSRALRNESFPS